MFQHIVMGIFYVSYFIGLMAQIPLFPIKGEKYSLNNFLLSLLVGIFSSSLFVPFAFLFLGFSGDSPKSYNSILYLFVPLILGFVCSFIPSFIVKFIIHFVASRKR